MNNAKRKPAYYLAVALFAILSLGGLYLIIWGGQFSFRNLRISHSRLENSKALIYQQTNKNNLVAEQNHLLVSDKTTQIRQSAELGYKLENEKIIKKNRSH